MGTSRGAELALILGSMFGGVRAVVSIVGGGYVVGSPLDPGSPAWIWKGKPLPYVTEETADSRDLERVEVRVENINGPILLVSADADEIWPSTELSRVAWERLQRLGHPFADQFLSFPGAGHMIAPPYLPLTADTAKDPVAQQAANVGAWRATLQVFESRSTDRKAQPGIRATIRLLQSPHDMFPDEGRYPWQSRKRSPS